MTTVFLVILLFVNGIPISDFLVFQSPSECREALAKVEASVKEQGFKPLYLACISDPGPTESAAGS